jgi:hypothetical protein
MVDENVPTIELHCLNRKCGRTFTIELSTLFENKGRADCPHCSEHNFYDLNKAKP